MEFKKSRIRKQCCKLDKEWVEGEKNIPNSLFWVKVEHCIGFPPFLLDSENTQINSRHYFFVNAKYISISLYFMLIVNPPSSLDERKSVSRTFAAEEK